MPREGSVVSARHRERSAGDAQAIAATLHPPGALANAMRTDESGKQQTFATAGCSGCHR